MRFGKAGGCTRLPASYDMLAQWSACRLDGPSESVQTCMVVRSSTATPSSVLCMVSFVPGLADLHVKSNTMMRTIGGKAGSRIARRVDGKLTLPFVTGRVVAQIC